MNFIERKNTDFDQNKRKAIGVGEEGVLHLRGRVDFISDFLEDCRHEFQYAHEVGQTGEDVCHRGEEERLVRILPRAADEHAQEPEYVEQEADKHEYVGETNRF